MVQRCVALRATSRIHTALLTIPERLEVLDPSMRLKKLLTLPRSFRQQRQPLDTKAADDVETQALAPSLQRWRRVEDSEVDTWYDLPVALGVQSSRDSVEDGQDELIEPRRRSPVAPAQKPDGHDGPGNFICAMAGAIQMSKNKWMKWKYVEQLAANSAALQTLSLEKQWGGLGSRPGATTLQGLSRLLTNASPSRTILLGMSLGSLHATRCAEIVESATNDQMRAVVLWDPRLPSGSTFRPLNISDEYIHRKIGYDHYFPEMPWPACRVAASALLLRVGFYEQEDVDVDGLLEYDYSAYSTSAIGFQALQAASLKDSDHMCIWYGIRSSGLFWACAFGYMSACTRVL